VLIGVRLGVPTNVLELYGNEDTAPMHAAFYRQLEVLKAAGAIIVEGANFTAAAEFQKSPFHYVY
jgi:amidase